ncbi:MAG: DUF4783 domain-containing protein [Melioribacter sp.]|nr:DUF4783 domain-containing protein [Melioribacter sp.]
MKKYIPCSFLGLYILFSTTSVNYSQEAKLSEIVKLFIYFEDGLNNNSIDRFASYFSEKSFLSLLNGITGYYSANQCYYILKDFLSIYKPLSFKLTNIVTDSSNPFASGVLKYNSKGIKGSAIVFISLHFVNNKWRISQVTIN